MCRCFQLIFPDAFSSTQFTVPSFFSFASLKGTVKGKRWLQKEAKTIAKDYCVMPQRNQEENAT
jgi:hypothetical protein